MEMPYIRVGSTYWIIFDKPQPDKTVRRVMKEWSKTTILDDLKGAGESISLFHKIPKYLDYCLIPSHTNFEQEYLKCYNKYHKLSHEPEEGKFDNIEKFLKHIFREQYEVGLDYIQILYENPIQKLPILCLISKEKNTGKTTFNEFLMSIFEENTLKIDASQLTNHFNAEWRGKLLLCMEEVKIASDEAVNKLKDLSTSSRIAITKKSIDTEQEHHYSKIVLNSNHEEDFLTIDDTDNRFWVRKIPEFETEDRKLPEKMHKEIPYFLDFLSKRKLRHSGKGRFYFGDKITWTPALEKVRLFSQPKIGKNAALVLSMAMDGANIDKLNFTQSDLQSYLKNSKCRFSLFEIKELLKKEWELVPVSNSLSYTKVSAHPDGSFYKGGKVSGRYYTVTRDFLREKYPDLIE